MKICPKHKIRKQREPAGKLRCPLCNKEKLQEYLTNNPEYMRKRYTKDLVKWLLYRAKKRAIEKEIEFTITVANIEVPKYCPALGIRLRVRKGQKGYDSPTLDRIDPRLGYVPGNVAVISDLANRIKSNATVEQIEAVAKWLRSL